MVENPYPIPRQLRQSGVLLGDGGDTYGPFGFKIFDPEDVVVCVRPVGALRFVEAAGVVVTKLNGNTALNPLDDFRIKFAALLPETTRYVVLSSRVAARAAGVMSGTRINPDALERELSKIATQQQELRRDINRAVMSDFGAPSLTIDPDMDDGRTLMKEGDRLVAGPDLPDLAASLIAEATAQANRSRDEADRSEAARDIAAGYASDAVSQGNVPIYATIMGMPALEIKAGINAIRVNGRAAAGDGYGGLYVDQNNGSNDTFVTADGRTWYRAQDVSSDRIRLPDEYLGYVATGALVPTTLFGTNKQSMTRSVHQMRDAVLSVQLLYPGFAVQGNPAAETPIGAPAFVRATVEYPEGIFNRVTFSGAETGTVPDGGMLLADELSVTIPRGAQFWIRTHYESTGGIIYTEWANAVMNFGVSGVPDQTGGGTIVDGSAVDHGYVPVAILGMTNRPSVAIIGDSRATGTTDTLNESGERGTIMRSIGPEVAYSGIVKGGDRLMYWLASSINRRQIASYASHIILQLGINDNRGGRTEAQMISDMQSIRALFPDKKCYLTTFEPSSDSTDNWATLENQTTHNHNNRRVSLNNIIRSGGVASFEGYFELADVMESSRDSGLVRVNGTPNYWTTDGLHWNQRGNILIEQSGAVQAQQFFDPLTDRSLRPASADEMRIGKATESFVSPAMFLAGLREHGFKLVASNANGNAYASPSGLQVCISPEVDLSTVPVTTAAGPLFVSASQVWVFPRNFALPPFVSGQPMRSNDTVVAGVSLRASPTTSAVNYLFWLSTSTAGVSGRTARLCAIGIGV